MLRVDVLGVGISCIDLDGVLDTFDRWIADSAREYVCVTGMHGVMESSRSEELREIHNRSGITTPDGMPMVWSGRWAGASISACTAPTSCAPLRQDRPRRAGHTSSSAARPRSTRSWSSACEPSSRVCVVAGTLTPPFRPLNSEPRRTPSSGRSTRPPPTSSGSCLGTPKQERWMARQPRCPRRAGARRRRRGVRPPGRHVAAGPAMDATTAGSNGCSGWPSSPADCGGATFSTYPASSSRCCVGPPAWSGRRRRLPPSALVSFSLMRDSTPASTRIPRVRRHHPERGADEGSPS